MMKPLNRESPHARILTVNNNDNNNNNNSNNSNTTTTNNNDDDNNRYYMIISQVFEAFVEDNATISLIVYLENHVSHFLQNRRK